MKHTYCGDCNKICTRSEGVVINKFTLEKRWFLCNHCWENDLSNRIKFTCDFCKCAFSSSNEIEIEVYVFTDQNPDYNLNIKPICHLCRHLMRLLKDNELKPAKGFYNPQSCNKK